MVSFSRESNNRTEPPADNDIKITSVFSSTIQFDFYCLLLYAAFQRQHFLLLRADFLFRFSAFRRVVLFLRVRVSDLNDDDDDMRERVHVAHPALFYTRERREELENSSKSSASLRERERKTERNREQNVQKYVPEQETEHQEHENGH